MIRLAVRVARGQAEEVLAELLELAPAGVEETELDDGSVEYAIYGSPGELPALPDLRALAGEALVEVSTRAIADDWQERWKQFHRPVLVPAPAGAARVPSVLMRPPWDGARDTATGAGAGAPPLEIVIDPGQAFGTGAHASTRLCLALLLELAASEDRRGPLLDVGTGSGVLAIAAAMLGFAPVLALDHDPASVEAAAVNAAANGTQIEVRRHDLRAGGLPAHRVVLANLLRPLLAALPPALEHPAPAHLIAGGLLAGELEETAALLARALGLRERRRLCEGEWAAVWLSRAPAGAQAPTAA